MISLIKNELIKIFSKKTIYIILAICLGYVVLTNYIYKKYDLDANYVYDETSYINDLKEEQKTIDLKKDDNIDWYVSNQTMIDIYELKTKYGLDSWQTAVIDTSGLNEILYQINYLTYGKYKDKATLKKQQKAYNKIIEKFDTDDWKSFVNENIKDLNETLKNQQKALKKAKGTVAIKEAESAIFHTELAIEINNLRLEKDIMFGNDYLNGALNNYESAKSNWYNTKDEERDYEKEIEFNETLKTIAMSKYTIDNNYNDGYDASMRSAYKNFFNEYQFLIIIIIVVICGVIVSEEFNKGTIKMLLVRPHTRAKILLSKYLTCLIMMVFAVVAIFLFQTVVGAITFGTGSLSVPVASYNYISGNVVTQNIFVYMLTCLVAKIPIFILLGTLAFTLSTLFGSSALAIAITLIGTVGSDIINLLVISYDVKFMKYFVTLNWDFTEYLFGGMPQFKYINFNFSVIICAIYFLIMVITSFLVFKKKNIKNI